MNRTNSGANTNIGKIFMDILALVASFLFTLIVNIFRNNIQGTWTLFPLLFVFGAIYVVTNRSQDVYDVTLFFYFDRILRKIILSFGFAFVVTYMMVAMAREDVYDDTSYYIFLFASLVSIVIFTYIYRRFNDRFDKRGIPRVAFAGRKGEFNKFRYFLDKTNIQYELVGYIAYSQQQVTPEYLGALDNLDDIIKKNNLDQVYIMDSHDVDLHMVQENIDLCVRMGVTCRVIANMYKRRRCNSFVSTVGTYPLITYHTVSFNKSEELIKRIMDIVGSLVGIILSSPIMLITAIAIKIDSPGPVFFMQTRVGKNGRHFKMFKFRSMCNDAEAMKKQLMKENQVKDGAMFKMKDDPRVTRVGKFIRKTSIDELPQFFNIFVGSMSLVGTRPPTLDEVAQYDDTQWRRISIKPGLTGMWQVSGRSDIRDFDEVVRLDTEYIDNWSIFLDIDILIQTVLQVFKRKGAY